MPSSFKEEDPRPDDEVEQNIIVIRPLSSESVTYLTSLPSYCHGQANFLTSTPISPVTTTTSSLPSQSFQGTPEDFSSLFFPTLTTSGSSSISLSSPPSYSDSLSSLTFHTFSDQPVSSLSYTLTSSVPSSFPPSYPIHRPTPIYTYSRPSSFSVGSIPYLYSSVLSTNTLTLSYHGSSSTRVSFASSGPTPCGPREGPPVAEPETGSGAVPETLPITLPGGKVSGLSLLAAPFPCFPPGPTLPVTGIIP